MILLVAITLIGLGLLLSIIAFNTRIMTSHSPKSLRLLVQAVAPPTDLYTPLGTVDFDVSQGGLVARVEFVNKYVGQHVVSLLLAKFQEDLYFKDQDHRFRPDLKLMIVFTVGNTVLLKRYVENSYLPFIGKNGSGFSLFEYNVPEELPIAQKIMCEVRIMQGDHRMQKEYGPVRFLVRKASDM
jgi:hypothetical protein